MPGVSPSARCSSAFCTHLAHHDEPRMQAKPYSQPTPLSCSRRPLRCCMASRMPNPVGRPVAGHLHALTEAKIDQQSITEVLGDIAIKGLDDLGAGLLIARMHIP